jgi:hypothetical protein
MNRIWESSSGNLCLQFTKSECDSVPATGEASPAIEKLLTRKRCMLQFALISENRIIAHLQELGAWDDLRIVDRKTLIERLLWVAIMDLKEEYRDKN